MADYAVTITKDNPRVERISKNYGFIIGKADITNYNTTGAEITDITKYFEDNTTPIRVINDGISDNGYLVRWNTTDKCFHVYYPFAATAGSETAGANNTLVKTSSAGPTEVAGTGTAYGQPGTEVANDVDVGEVNFIAFGLIK